MAATHLTLRPRRKRWLLHARRLLRHGLTQREGEVLLLLAQQKSAADIEQELLVANGTAKAHIRHVYQKLGIHSREELYEMVASK